MPPVAIKRIPSFWVGVLLILALAGALRLASYQFSLPYIDHPDEPVFFYQAQVWLGQFDLQGYLDYYPPVYIALNALTQGVMGLFGAQGIAAVLPVLRLLAVIANLLTLVFIALAARRAAGDTAGLAAGAAWGIAPLVLKDGVYATPDPLVYLWVAAALWLAAGALTEPGRGRWSLWSFIAGLLAFLTKYPVVPALAPGVLAALVIWRRDRRVGRRYLGIQAGLFLLVVALLLTVYPITAVQREGQIAIQEGPANLLDIQRVLNNIIHAIIPLNLAAFFIIGGLGLLAYIIAARRGLARVHAGLVGFGALLLVTIPWLASTFSQVAVNDRMKDVLPATPAACMMLGAALAQIAHILPARWPTPGRAALVALPLIALVFVPQLQEDAALIHERQLPDRRVALRQWFDLSLDLGTVLVGQDNHKTFNPLWGGIPHRNWVDWWVMDDLLALPLADWRDQRGMAYVVLTPFDLESLQASAQGRAALFQMLHLRDFTAPGWRGPEMSIYRLWRMQFETDYVFGDAIRLIGYDISSNLAEPGTSLTLRFYWQAYRPPADNYSLFIHLTPRDADQVLAQADGAPGVAERPTLTWTDAGETLISPPFVLSIPDAIAPGEYRLMVGLYNYVSGARLPVFERGGETLSDSLELTRVSVPNVAPAQDDN